MLKCAPAFTAVLKLTHLQSEHSGQQWLCVMLHRNPVCLRFSPQNPPQKWPPHVGRPLSRGTWCSLQAFKRPFLKSISSSSHPSICPTAQMPTHNSKAASVTRPPPNPISVFLLFYNFIWLLAHLLPIPPSTIPAHNNTTAVPASPHLLSLYLTTLITPAPSITFHSFHFSRSLVPKVRNGQHIVCWNWNDIFLIPVFAAGLGFMTASAHVPVCTKETLTVKRSWNCPLQHDWHQQHIHVQQPQKHFPTEVCTEKTIWPGTRNLELRSCLHWVG